VKFKAKGAKLRVRSSKPVAQTLNLLGGKSWLEIEVSSRPNPKPGETARPVKGPAARKKVPGPVHKISNTPIHQGSVASYRPSLHITAAAATRREAKPSTPAAATTPRFGASSGHPEPGEDVAMKEALDRKGHALVEDDVALGEDLEILRKLLVLETYTFHFQGDSDLTAKALKHLCGPWILTDSKGTRRMVNILRTTFIDRLS